MRKRGTSGLSTGSFVSILILVLALGTLLIIFVLPPENTVPTLTSPSASTSTAKTSKTTITLATTTASSTLSQSGSSSTSSSASLSDPSIRNGSATITFPSDYDQLANYTLGLVNKDRAFAGLRPASLSPVLSAQQHADSMLHFRYFSHWDTQGYKPYMRYSLLGGPGGVEENVAYEYFPSHFLNTSDAEQGISRLEHEMIYNDSACCQNGHRDNILEPIHNRISIGIAYNESYLYVVQDFENYVLNFSNPVLSGDDFHLIGPSSTRLGQVSVYVFFDKFPVPLTSSQLNKLPYQGSYNQGTFIGGVVPPCSVSCSTYPGNITVTAQTWSVSQSNVSISFNLSDFVRAYGRGVYTVILAEGETKPVILFSLSIFVKS